MEVDDDDGVVDKWDDEEKVMFEVIEVWDDVMYEEELYFFLFGLFRVELFVNDIELGKFVDI